MQFPNEVLVRIIILVLGVCGFFVARYIRNHKVKNTPLICPIGFNCHAVVHSDYSKFLGIPTEVLGMAYYALVSLASLAFIFSPEILSNYIFSIYVLISLGAVLFSFYLLGIQIFVLKKGCSWCIASAFITALIFVLTMVK